MIGNGLQDGGPSTDGGHYNSTVEFIVVLEVFNVSLNEHIE